MSAAAQEPPAWQRGYPLDLLRGFATVFKARHKGLVHGAFGLTKERDIADALGTDSLLWKTGANGHPAACAIAHRLRSQGGFTDFAAREVRIPAGAVKVASFACTDIDAGAAVLAALERRAPLGLWVELFEEDETARAAMARLPGLTYRATRIAAGSEVKGLYSNAPDVLAPLHRAEQASLVVMDREFLAEDECDALLGEIDAFAVAAEAAPWAQHYSSYNKRHSWTAFALRGFDCIDPGFIIKPAEMSQAWKAENPTRLLSSPKWTSACGHFPRTMACVNRILAGREADRVRLMRLTPGGELSRHADITDRDAGLADGRLARLHLPLRTSPEVIMHGWDKRGATFQTAFPRGALCYLDQRGPHRVENRDPSIERVHLVVDAHSDAALRDAIARGMGNGPAPLA